MNILDGDFDKYCCSRNVFDMVVRSGYRKYTIAFMEPNIMYGKKLYRIIATRNFGNVRIGDIGGFVEDRYNTLSHDGGCWIGDNAIALNGVKISDDAQVYGDAVLDGNMDVCGRAKVYEHAWLYTVDRDERDPRFSYRHIEIRDDAQIHGHARVGAYSLCIGGNAHLHGNACVWEARGDVMGGDYGDYMIPKDADELVKCPEGYTKKRHTLGYEFTLYDCANSWTLR